MSEKGGYEEIELAGYLVEIASVWLFSLMVFFVNPLNDMTDPAGKMNYYYCENVKIRQAVEESYSGEVHVEWQEMMPYIQTGFVAFLGWAMMRLAGFFVTR